MHLVVTGGGTGGHIYPAIAVAKRVLEEVPGAKVTFIGSQTGPEGAAADAAGIPFIGLEVAGFSGKSPLKAARAVALFFKAARQCRQWMKDAGVDCVLGTGGYASAPACLAARRLRVPLVIHEMNYEPGLVTRLFSKRAQAVAVAYAGTAALLNAKARTEVTGVPVRPEIEALSDAAARAGARLQAQDELRLDPGRRTLLVFGGSQGAQALNTALWDALPGIADDKGLQIVHLTGKKNLDDPGRLAAEKAVQGSFLIYRAIGYRQDIDLMYAASDLALSRAGAGTIAELMAAGLPAVLVPFPHATGGHQEKNARALEETGAVVVAPQDGASASRALDEALRLIRDEKSLALMRSAAGKATSARGAQGIASIVEELTKHES